MIIICSSYISLKECWNGVEHFTFVRNLSHLDPEQNLANKYLKNIFYKIFSIKLLHILCYCASFGRTPIYFCSLVINLPLVPT